MSEQRGERDEESREQGEAEEAEQEGARQPGADPEEADEIAADREERLDPDNRPENVEVDNTDRDFDAEKGMFTDSEGYEQAEERFPPPGEQGV
ncbi:hypothetical protein G5V58_00285 [Nocardioides anomalus]|uniref:Uncharacterized protein n=1 Tax=Nocardioides anomalus TaxID=2712223 RepID=A0A6G6W864_9ACTN|nr:hypothetical protein [Nocardioides anomalus]QIG41414.1 hypothetical protein G5V58_00285 [Nocardioides anomalus]